MIMIAGIRMDHFTKSLAVTHFTGEAPREIIPDILSLSLHYNSGIAFSIPVPLPALLIITAIMLCGISVYWYFTRADYSPLEHRTFALLLGGAISNGYDRAVHGQVVDFIALTHFAIFNVADILICVGAALFIAHNLFVKKYAK
jgi:signal peptidase II